MSILKRICALAASVIFVLVVGSGIAAVAMLPVIAGEILRAYDWTLTISPADLPSTPISPQVLERLRAQTHGTDNVAFGYQALQPLTTGSYNTAIGAGKYGTVDHEPRTPCQPGQK